MKLAYVQMNCEFGEIEKNLKKASDMMSAYNADLFVLPELFNSGYVFTSHEEVRGLAETIPAGQTCQILVDLAKKKKCYIAAGLAEKNGDECYNSAVLVGPQGMCLHYQKTHLFSDEKKWFKPGTTGFGVFDIGSCKIGLMVCFDWIFPESARTLALFGADIICHPTNLVMPYCQKAMTTRTLENGVFAVTANRIGTENRGGTELTFTGGSQIVDPRGTVLIHAAYGSEEIGVVEIDPLRARDKIIAQKNDLFGDRRPAMYYRDSN